MVWRRLVRLHNSLRDNICQKLSTIVQNFKKNQAVIYAQVNSCLVFSYFFSCTQFFTNIHFCNRCRLKCFVSKKNPKQSFTTCKLLLRIFFLSLVLLCFLKFALYNKLYVIKNFKQGGCLAFFGLKNSAKEARKCGT